MISASISRERDGDKSKLAVAQAVAALRAGQPEDAERILRFRLLERPDDIGALSKLGDILVEQFRNAEAILAYRRALALAPDADQIRFALAQVLGREFRPNEALREIEALGTQSRSGFNTSALEAALLGQIGEHERELAVYKRLVATFPRNEIALVNYGNALKTVGRTAEAIRTLRRAIKVRPAFGLPYWSLANLKTFRFDNRDISAMRRALEANPAEADAVHLHFALGKALEDRGQSEELFRHYAAGNQIRASRLAPAQLDVTPQVDAAIRTFTKGFFAAHKGTGCSKPDPIFVVGLQRSGSTLIEQILASHPLIEGVAELQVLDQLWFGLGRAGADPFAAVAKLSPAALRDLGAEYLDRTRAFRLTDRPFFVDKQAGNWLNIGFIKLILPNARIIDTRRHPLACGFSNFRQYYDSGVFFSYSLETIGRCYANYLRLMNHFDDVLPGTVRHVLNERLIDDPSGEIRGLLEHVGVPFDEACLEFHKTKRAVHSASSEQVRRPINRDGVDYWRRYDPFLGPLKDALGDASEHWDRLSD